MVLVIRLKFGDKNLDRADKEISLVEAEIEKTKSQMKKADATSASLCVSSAVLFFTTDPSSTIKLALLGVEVKSLYAVYFLYLFSLMLIIKLFTCDIRLSLLINRYKKLLIERYNEIPKSLPLILSNDVQLRQDLFIGLGARLYYALVFATGMPLLLGYLYLGYKLVSLSGQSKITFFISIFIVISSLNIIVLLFKSYIVDKDLKRYIYSKFED